MGYLFEAGTSTEHTDTGPKPSKSEIRQALEIILGMPDTEDALQASDIASVNGVNTVSNAKSGLAAGGSSLLEKARSFRARFEEMERSE